MNTIYESLPTLPPLAASIVICCLYVMLAGLAVWISARAGMELVKLYRRTLAAELRLEHMRQRDERATINGWIRDYYGQKEETAQERHRADQAEYNKKQIAKGAANLERRATA